MTGLRWDLSLENMVNNFFAFFPAAPYNNLLSGAFDVIQIFKCALPKYFYTLRLNLNIVKGLTVSPQPYGSTNSWCNGESFKRVELIRNSPDVRTEKMVSYRCKGRNKMLNVPAPTQIMGGPSVSLFIARIHNASALSKNHQYSDYDFIFFSEHRVVTCKNNVSSWSWLFCFTFCSGVLHTIISLKQRVRRVLDCLSHH